MEAELEAAHKGLLRAASRVVSLLVRRKASMVLMREAVTDAEAAVVSLKQALEDAKLAQRAKREADG